MSPNLRLYCRERGGERRWYADFRAFADVGGRREPLIPPGDTRATSDHEEAVRLAIARLDELRALRQGKPRPAPSVPVPLGAYVRHHIARLKAAGHLSPGRLEVTAMVLERALDFFGEQRAVTSIRVRDVRAWAEVLSSRQARPGKRAKPLSSGSVRAHLFVLSKLFRRAIEEELVQVNPVSGMMDKPAVQRGEARYLEVPDAALLLALAERLPPRPGSKLTPEQVVALRAAWKAGGHTKRSLAAVYGVSDVLVGRVLRGQDPVEPTEEASFAHPLLATFLLTGGRLQEVLGLELDDVSFDRRTVTFRPNQWRGLKTRTSHRVVPLWPQLEEILRPYVFGRRVLEGGRLLFPSFATGEEAMLREPRKLLDRIAVRGGWEAGAIRSKMFRHTYCSARLQTLDHGAPVSLYTVSRELGHGSEEMVRRVYAHLGTVRHRSDVVEYRLDQHLEVLAERLQKLGLGTTLAPRPTPGSENQTPQPSLCDGEAWSSDECARDDSNVRPLAPEASALSS